MNKTIAITAIALVTVVMGLSSVSPALATHTEDHRGFFYWYKELCETEFKFDL